MRNVITNTEKLSARTQLGLMAAFGTSNAIELMEAQGQSEFCRSDVLPAVCACGINRARWEALGVVFGEKIDGDPLFVNAKLPAGWTKKPDPLSSFSTILHDDQRRERAHIFYKAASYDRKADATLLPRFAVWYDWENEAETFAEVRTGKQAVYRTVAVPYPKDATGDELYDKRNDIIMDLQRECYAWLAASYPAYDDASAYWDIDIPEVANV